jgi:small-conductance mechanosensitive channel/CRP-like cAMP-binding protein
MIVTPIIALFLLALARWWDAGLLAGHFTPQEIESLNRALTVAMVVAVALFVDGLVRYFYWHRYWRRRRGRDTPALIRDILTLAIVLLSLSLGLWWQEGLSFTGLITASGATAVILGIALQTVIQDLFSGLSVNLEGSYALGDWLTIFSEHLPEPVYGCVTGITWRATFLTLENGCNLMVPNHLVTANAVLNHSRPREPKRLEVELQVDIRMPYLRVTDMLLGEAIKVSRGPGMTILPEPSVVIDRLASGATFYRVRFYSDPHGITPTLAKSIMYRALLGVVQRHALPTPVTQVEMTQPPNLQPAEAHTEIHGGLHHTELFRHVLDDEQISFLASRSKVVEFARDATLMRQGEAAASMFIILEGAARITLASGQEAPQEVAVLATGDIVGEMSLMTGSNRSATVTAITRLRTLEITKEPMAELLQKSPELLSRFSQVLTQRQEELNVLSHRTLYKAPDAKDVMTRMKEFFSHVLD